MVPRKTALVTGATSGLGLEAAAQLLDLGYDVVITGRTEAKAQRARNDLVERAGRKDSVAGIALDLGSLSSIRSAVSTLASQQKTLDFVLLNAGMVAGSEVVRADAGIEVTIASSLTGHHALVMGLLEEGLLAATARIVISGSEAATGLVPMFTLTDVRAHAEAHHGGDLVAAVMGICRAEDSYRYANMPHYGMAKLFVAWWAAALARRLPQGMVVTAISPGNAPATDAMRNQPAIVRFMASTMMSWVGGWIGMAATIPVAARRYVDGASYDASKSGGFYASAPGRMIGPVERQTQDHVIDEPLQEAGWAAVVQLTQHDLPARLAQVG